MTDAEPPLDLDLLREAAEAGFHATPPTVLALLDLLDRQARIIALYLAGHPDPLTADTRIDPRGPQLHAVPDPEPDPEPAEPEDWNVPLPLEDL